MKFKVALIQLNVRSVKDENIQKALKLIKEAAQNDAKIIILPEFFNGPFCDIQKNCEPIPGPTTVELSRGAKENKIYLIGGSIPEIDGSKIYNSCLVFDTNGYIIAKHRKVHLFDVDIPGKMKFLESESTTPGDSITIVDTEYGKIGLGICHDIRFTEMAVLYERNGCSMIFYPMAFEPNTGSAHLELLVRARAMDNQLYVAAICPAYSEEFSFKIWGHSCISNPYGEIISSAEFEETIVYAEIDSDKINEIRENLPYLKQKRDDLYKVIKID